MTNKNINKTENSTSHGVFLEAPFIPFFNLYWLFQVWGGFPTDYNRYVDEYSLPVPKLSNGLYIAYPILTLIPILGILLAPLVFIFVIVKTCNAVNRLADAKQQRQMVR